MIRKMISALDLNDCMKVMEALDSRLDDAIRGKNGENDYNDCLRLSRQDIKLARQELADYRKHYLLDRHFLGGIAKEKLTGLGNNVVACITYMRQLFPSMSIIDAKERYDLWRETGQ